MSSYINRFVGKSTTINAISIAVIVGTLLSYLLGDLSSEGQDYSHYLLMPVGFADIIFQPWTIFTYTFTFQFGELSFWGILWNIIIFYQFGRILVTFIGEEKVRRISIFTIFFNGIIILIICNLVPLFRPHMSTDGEYLFGLTTLSATIVTATITIAPRYPMRLFLIRQIPILWVGIGILVLKFFYSFITQT